MNVLTNKQIAILRAISAGNKIMVSKMASKSTLNSLHRKGMIRIYPPIGWVITQFGNETLKELADGQ
ncbi:hypothetical protein EFZ62_16175 [Serratia marcescens]|uniref:hypothetical protein n=1 Tax=Serratia marcescens TaxID=615 RepID=UPI001318760A|nr:hypothetical protein [Serratia marcescens]QHC46417.1 hypothetical protein EFZ62_16175 [Serratia marcescens]